MNKECDDDEMPTEYCRLGIQHKSLFKVESPLEDDETEEDDE